ncbi:MAG: hypothetical protein IRY89_08080 [Pseudolabrys sp.]|nr:hypothetical protein [Pseudolabrys sp.]
MPPLPLVATMNSPRSRILVALSLAVALLVSVAAGLWAYYGTTVFFEMVRSGWASCF